MRAYLAAKAKGLPLIIGGEFQLTAAALPGPKLVLLCVDRAGYGNLCELITLARRRAANRDRRSALLRVVSQAPWEICLTSRVLWFA